MFKLIFLDIDGVLNSHRFWDTVGKYRSKIDMETELDPISSNVLKEIVEETDAKIIISSTWRFSYYDFLVEYLSSYNIKVIGKTGRGCVDCVRGNEILSWIKANEKVIGEHYYNYKNYVILDDDSDMLYWQKDNFVHIDNKIGLIEDHKKEIIRILNQ